MATKKQSKRAKVRAYIFTVDGREPVLVIVARSKEEAEARWKDNGGEEGAVPHAAPVRFAY